MERKIISLFDSEKTFDKNPVPLYDKILEEIGDLTDISKHNKNQSTASIHQTSNYMERNSKRFQTNQEQHKAVHYLHMYSI